MRKSRFVCVLIASFCAFGATVEAGELNGMVGGAGAVSSWDNDSALLSYGKLGYRLDERFGVHAFGIGGYSGVGKRVLTAGGLGAQLWLPFGKVQPFVRGGLLIWNESPYAKAANDPLGTVFGTNEGSHRRLGAVVGAGFDVPLWRVSGATFFATLDVSALYFGDNEGPASYVTGMVGLGVNLDLKSSTLAN